MTVAEEDAHGFHCELQEILIQLDTRHANRSVAPPQHGPTRTLGKWEGCGAKRLGTASFNETFLKALKGRYHSPIDAALHQERGCLIPIAMRPLRPPGYSVDASKMITCVVISASAYLASWCHRFHEKPTPQVSQSRQTIRR